MKAKLERYLRWLREGFLQMLRLHPVESALTVYACAGCLLTYELDWDHSLPKLALAALFFAVALVVNNLAGRGPWRRARRCLLRGRPFYRYQCVQSQLGQEVSDAMCCKV